MDMGRKPLYGGPWSHYISEILDAEEHGGYRCPKCGERFPTFADRNQHAVMCKGNLLNDEKTQQPV
jgi:hypothetical protein